MSNTPIAIVVDYSYHFMDFYDTISFSLEDNVPAGSMEEIITSSVPEDLMNSAFNIMKSILGPRQTHCGTQWIMPSDVVSIERHKEVQKILYPEYNYSQYPDVYTNTDLMLTDYLFDAFKRNVAAEVNPEGKVFICNEEITLNALYKVFLEIIIITAKALLNVITQKGLNEIEYTDIDLSCVRQIDESSYTYLLQLKCNIPF